MSRIKYNLYLGERARIDVGRAEPEDNVASSQGGALHIDETHQLTSRYRSASLLCRHRIAESTYESSAVGVEDVEDQEWRTFRRVAR